MFCLFSGSLSQCLYRGANACSALVSLVWNAATTTSLIPVWSPALAHELLIQLPMYVSVQGSSQEHSALVSYCKNSLLHEIMYILSTTDCGLVCENGGIVEDPLDCSACDCLSGFEGTTCGDNISECADILTNSTSV